MDKILISYFSATGKTKKIAESIKNIIGGDLFEIEPKDKYTTSDLDWTNSNSRSSIEMNNKTYRPPTKNKNNNIEEYNKIIIGFPIWWYTAPTIINTFIEENNLNNKKIYIFATSGGSGVDRSFNDLKDTYNNLNFINSLLINDINKDEIIEWINK